MIVLMKIRQGELGISDGEEHQVAIEGVDRRVIGGESKDHECGGGLGDADEESPSRELEDAGS